MIQHDNWLLADQDGLCSPTFLRAEDAGSYCSNEEPAQDLNHAMLVLKENMLYMYLSAKFQTNFT